MPRRAAAILRTLSLAAVVAAVAGCALVPSGPSVGYTPRRPYTHVVPDQGETARLVSALRARRGLGPVTVDPQLSAIAQTQANAMARTASVSHTVGGSFTRRLAAGGYQAQAAAENIGAGFHDLAEAMAAWEASPGHRANLLNPGVTRIGIATAYAPQTQLKLYWAMVLASPYEPQAERIAGPPGGGPANVIIGGR